MVKYFGSVHSDQLQRFDQLVVNGNVGVDGLLRHGLAVWRNEIPEKNTMLHLQWPSLDRNRHKSDTNN